jgi:hypothetical protein
VLVVKRAGGCCGYDQNEAENMYGGLLLGRGTSEVSTPLNTRDSTADYPRGYNSTGTTAVTRSQTRFLTISFIGPGALPTTTTGVDQLLDAAISSHPKGL